MRDHGSAKYYVLTWRLAVFSTFVKAPTPGWALRSMSENAADKIAFLIMCPENSLLLIPLEVPFKTRDFALDFLVTQMFL